MILSETVSACGIQCKYIIAWLVVSPVSVFVRTSARVRPTLRCPNFYERDDEAWFNIYLRSRYPWLSAISFNMGPFFIILKLNSIWNDKSWWIQKKKYGHAMWHHVNDMSNCGHQLYQSVHTETFGPNFDNEQGQSPFVIGPGIRKFMGKHVRSVEDVWWWRYIIDVYL